MAETPQDYSQSSAAWVIDLPISVLNQVVQMYCYVHTDLYDLVHVGRAFLFMKIIYAALTLTPELWNLTTTSEW
jgi:hypothetical protein